MIGPLEQLDCTLTEQMEYAEVAIRAVVEYPFRVFKRQFDYVKVRCKGLAKNGALFALGNVKMARRTLLQAT